MTLSGTQLIGGQESSLGQSTFQGFAPATGKAREPIFYEGTVDEVDRAFQLAHEVAPDLRSRSITELAGLLERVAESLETDRDAISHHCEEETGYPKPRVNSEFGRMVHHWRRFAEIIREGHWLEATLDKADPGRLPLPKPDLRKLRVPLGPVAVFGASNFPLALSVAGSDPLTALAVGCPVVVKGHPSHPATSELLARAILRGIEAAGFPAGTFSLLQGTSHALGEALVTHPLATAVGFTGSLRGGRALFDLAAVRPSPIPVFAEMGSVNPQFVFPSILTEDPKRFAERLFASVTMGNGQFCTCPSLIFLPAGPETESFASHYLTLANAAPPTPLLNEGIAQGYQAGLQRWASLEGVSLLTSQGDSTTPALGRLDFATFQKHQDTLLEEVFGPATLFVTCEDTDTFLQAAKLFPGQLGTSVHGTETALAEEAKPLLHELQRLAGRIVINGFPTGIETAHAMQHGGPYPATTNSQHTSLGLDAIHRWTRPVCYQDTPDLLLPPALQNDNPLGIPRRIDGSLA